jgi:signal transduction histidine kinase
MQFTVYALLLACSSFISGGLIWYASKRYKEPIIQSFILLMIGITLWSVTYFFEAIGTNPDVKIFWGELSVIDQVVPVMFLYFTLQITRFGEKIPFRALLLLLIIPALSLFLSLTQSIHGLLWPELILSVTRLAGISIIYIHGAWYWVELVYSVLLYVAAAFILLLAIIRSSSIYAMQYWLIFISSVFPLVAALLYAFAQSFLKGIDLTPVSFSLTGIILCYAIYKYKLLDLLPIAHDQILANILEGVIVIDEQDRILEMNPAAYSLFSESQDIIGKPYPELLPFKDPDNISIIDYEPKSKHTLNIQNKWIEIRTFPIINSQKDLVGKIFICFDVTRREMDQDSLNIRNQELEKLNSLLAQEIAERKITEDNLRLANKKLNLVTGITRHDILNGVTVIAGYADILQDSFKDKNEQEQLRRIAQAGEIIREIISFTSIYDDIDDSIPHWTSLTDIFNAPEISQFKDRISIHLQIPELEVMPELVFKKVFYNLLDNTMRHSNGSDTVTISGHAVEEKYCLIYEDNGIGILAEDKEKIFRQGYGKNTGLGMYLIREILGIADIQIKENGILGKGARFEILIPNGGFRYRSV